MGFVNSTHSIFLNDCRLRDMRQTLLFSLIVFLTLSADTLEERIAWSDDYHLVWSDFKGQPKTGDYVASTSSGLSFSYGFKTINGIPTSEFTYEVTCYFYPEGSWFVPGRVNERVLSHEQTHFDISELHARKLRKRIEDFDFSINVKEELDELYAQIERERRAMQATFDLETDHSTLLAEERAWEAKVQQQLKAFSDWKE